MSDYLGNLAARSLDPVPAVRPRLASRFEPRSPAAAPLAASPAAAEPALVEESVEVRAETPRPRRSRRRVVMAAEPAVIEEPVEVRAETPRPQRSRRRVVMAAEPAEERTVEVRGEEVAIPPVVRPQRGMADREAQPFETSPPGPLSSGAGEGGRGGRKGAPGWRAPLEASLEEFRRGVLEQGSTPRRSRSSTGIRCRSCRRRPYTGAPGVAC